MKSTPEQQYLWQQQRHDQIETWLDLLELRAGSVLADFGCGPGYASLLALSRVGGQGLVYAIDRSQAMIDYLRRLIEEQQLQGIEPVCSDVTEDLQLDPAPDAVLIANMLHHTSKLQAVIHQAGRVLKKNGKLLIVEFDPEGPAPFGPPRSMRLPADKVFAALKEEAMVVLSQGRTPPDWYYVLAAHA